MTFAPLSQIRLPKRDCIVSYKLGFGKIIFYKDRLQDGLFVFRLLAQLVARRFHTAKVTGSSPVEPTNTSTNQRCYIFRVVLLLLLGF